MSVLRDVLLIVFSLLISVFMGVTGIFWAAPAADVLAIFVTAAVMVRVWKELGQEKEEREPAAAAIRPSRQGTVITIAREHGSAGKRIGQMVAENWISPAITKNWWQLPPRKADWRRNLFPASIPMKMPL